MTSSVIYYIFFLGYGPLNQLWDTNTNKNDDSESLRFEYVSLHVSGPRILLRQIFSYHEKEEGGEERVEYPSFGLSYKVVFVSTILFSNQ